MKMRLNARLSILFALTFCLAGPWPAHGWDTSGHVFCDVNQNETIDTGDAPLPGILVVVTNQSGTFSNADYTTTPDGAFVLNLPNQADTYIEYLDPATLSASTVQVLPAGGVYQFTLDGVTQSNFIGDFLVSDPACQSLTNAPPPGTNLCCVTACGSIKSTNCQVQDVFAGTVFPPCKGDANRIGIWTDTAVHLGLCLKGKILQVLDCGPFTNSVGDTNLIGDFIEFQGVGTLKSKGRNQQNCTAVSFYVRLEDFGEPGRNLDRYYLRVSASDGTVLLLVSDDPDNATDVAPVAISSGNIRFSNCEPQGHKPHGHDQNGPGPKGGDKGGHRENKGGHKGGKNGDKHGDPGHGNGKDHQD